MSDTALPPDIDPIETVGKSAEQIEQEQQNKRDSVFLQLVSMLAGLSSQSDDPRIQSLADTAIGQVKGDLLKKALSMNAVSATENAPQSPSDSRSQQNQEWREELRKMQTERMQRTRMHNEQSHRLVNELAEALIRKISDG